jgi:hypothetical protein
MPRRATKPKSRPKVLSPEAARKSRASVLALKWQSGKTLSKFDDEFLHKERPELFGNKESEIICTTNREIARLISEHFIFPCLEHSIAKWRRGEDIPPGTPLFPQPDPATKRFNVPACYEWFKAHKMPRTGGNVTQEQADLFESDRVDKVKRAQEHRDFERFEEAKARGEYVRLDAVIGYAAGSARQLTVHYDKLIEDKEGLRASVQWAASELGLSEEQRLKLDVLVAASFLKSNSALKARFKKIAADLDEKIEALKEGN